MKKLLVLLCAAALLCSMMLSAGAVDIANPVTMCASLEEINALVDVDLHHPAVMGVTDESFATVRAGDYTIAEYRFNLNGWACVMRAAHTTEEISGVYIDGALAFDDGYSTVIDFRADASFKLARWFCYDVQYVLGLVDNGEMDMGTFTSIAQEMAELTGKEQPIDAAESAFYDALAGKYIDVVSGRATAQVNSLGDALAIEIRWAESADEEMMWTMIAEMQDGLLVYSDCRLVRNNYTDSGMAREELVYLEGQGYFVEYNGDLIWEGAADEGCDACVFVNEDAYQNDFEAVYDDMVSQRAWAEVTVLEDMAYVTVHWSNNAFEDEVWELTAYITDNGMWAYNDCCYSTVIFAEDGSVGQDIHYVDGAGFFSMRNGLLYWEGAADEQCRACIFAQRR